MRHFKKTLALVLALVMVLSAFPLVSAASAAAGTVSVQSKSAMPGDTVDVNIVIEGNTGILGAAFSITYHSDLTLVNAKAGDAFSALVLTKPGKFASPCRFVFDGQELAPEDIKDGVILTLSFEVSEDAAPNQDLPISVSYKKGEIISGDMQSVDLETVAGAITVIDYLPGDLNGDGTVNSTDAILLRRYIAGGYDLDINELAADVNDDGSAGPMDILLLRRYIAGGYGVELLPSHGKCSHIMDATAAKAATCTEDGNIAYWHCTVCDKYFSDAEGEEEISADSISIAAFGHTPVTDEAVAATYTSTGLTQGSHCAVCNEVLVAQEFTPMIPRQEHAITYDLSNGDSYLAKASIQNSNPNSFVENEGLVLKNLSVPGYQFLGWYDGAGDNATQIKTIAAGTKHDVELVAHWKKIKYKVQFKSSLFLEENELTYTVDTGAVLPTPKLSNYVFVGWTDEEGELYNKTMIPAGTTGNIVLTANWTSERNKTWTKDKLDAPIFEIDEENNTLLFVYEIGAIENVPLYTIKDFGYISGDGVTKSETATYTVTISESAMEAYTKAVSNATTQSSNWTLSEDWNEITSIDEQRCLENGYTKEEAETLGKSDTETWNISSGSSGSKETTDLSTNQNNWQREVQLNGGESATQSTKESGSFELSVGNKAPSVTGGIEVNGGVSGSVENQDSVTYSMGYEDGGGWGESELKTTSTVTNSGWNSSKSHNTSSTTSSSKTTSSSISEKICETYGYGKSYASGGSSSSSQALSSSQSSTDEYAASVTYSTATSKETTSTWTTQSTKAGYHRWVVAGTAHVFAVVGYNMAEKAYFVYTFSVMDDETHEFEDYSYTTANYNDEQNGVISFEVPYEVAEYVSQIVCFSEGLKVDQNTGTITGYTGSDNCVVIPEYMNVGNGKVIKITGISSTAFQGNTEISAVILSDFVSKIPDNAFAGCTSLFGVAGGRVSSIGKNAFNGCTAIEKCVLSSNITELGENAFEGVGRLQISADNASVLEAAIRSGAKRIEVSVEDMDGGAASLTGKTLTVPSGTEYFEFNGNKQTYTDVALISDAGKTVIKEATFVNTNTIPVKISSPEVEFDDVTVKATGIAMVLSANTTKVGLQGTINVQSENTNALLCKNLSLYETNPAVDGKLSVIDKILVCGSVTGRELLTYNAYETIDLTTFNNLLNSYTLYFNLDGGSCSETSRKVANSMPIGELPTPTKAYYTFAGWYLADGKTKATASTVFSTGTDQTLYAHWTLNPVSDWVKKSEMPADAQLINTKWTYTYRDWKTSSSSSMSGYTRDDSKTTYTINWNGTVTYYDSQRSTSETYRYVGTRSVENGTETYLYNYYNPSTGKSSLSPASGFVENGYWVPTGDVYQWNPFSSSSTVTYTTDALKAYGYPFNKGGTRTAYKTQYGYQSGTKVYTYSFYQDQQKESTTYPTGSNISNIVEWVQYRAK